MNAIPPSFVPVIQINGTDDVSILLTGDTRFDISAAPSSVDDPNPGYQAAYSPYSYAVSDLPELEEMTEFSHLSSHDQPFISGSDIAFPYSEEYSSGIFMPSSPMPSSSPGSSISPVSPFGVMSDFPSPATSVSDQLPWSTHYPDYSNNHPCLIGSLPGATLSMDCVLPEGGPQRPPRRISLRGPVASKAMLEANGRRRRHPAQFSCPECDQTFTALFSLRRHTQSHTGERPYVCSVDGCDQRFFNSSDCKRHEKSKKRHKGLVTQ